MSKENTRIRGSILVIDDEPESLRVLADLLTDEGFEVRPADSGDLALRSIAAKTPDLILLDIRLPGVDGFEVFQRINASNSSNQIPVIFLSASKNSQEHVTGLRLGAVDFLTKPFQRDELLARVEVHLELHSLRVSLESQVASRTADLMAANRLLHEELNRRLLTEQALRESEERFRSMADTAPVMIWAAGPDKAYTFVNKGWLEFTGRSMVQELGDGWAEHVHPDDISRYLEVYSTNFDARQPFDMEYRLRRRDGEYRWMLGRGVPQFTSDATLAGYFGSCIDITDLKRHQETRMAAQKLESLGTLSAGIANDFNNLLGAILSEADLALSELTPDSPAYQSIERISDIEVRGSRIVNLLLAYAGTGVPPIMEPLDVSTLVDETVRSMRVSGSNLVLKTTLAPDLPLVAANASQMEWVVLNLLMWDPLESTCRHASLSIL